MIVRCYFKCKIRKEKNGFCHDIPLHQNISLLQTTRVAFVYFAIESFMLSFL